MSWGVDLWVSSPKAACARQATAGTRACQASCLIARVACVPLPEEACKQLEKGSKDVAARERVAGSTRGECIYYVQRCLAHCSRCRSVGIGSVIGCVLHVQNIMVGAHCSKQ